MLLINAQTAFYLNRLLYVMSITVGRCCFQKASKLSWQWKRLNTTKNNHRSRRSERTIFLSKSRCFSKTRTYCHSHAKTTWCITAASTHRIIWATTSVVRPSHVFCPNQRNAIQSHAVKSCAGADSSRTTHTPCFSRAPPSQAYQVGLVSCL